MIGNQINSKWIERAVISFPNDLISDQFKFFDLTASLVWGGGEGYTMSKRRRGPLGRVEMRRWRDSKDTAWVSSTRWMSIVFLLMRAIPPPVGGRGRRTASKPSGHDPRITWSPVPTVSHDSVTTNHKHAEVKAVYVFHDGCGLTVDGTGVGKP